MVTQSHGHWQDDTGQWQEPSVPQHMDLPAGLLRASISSMSYQLHTSVWEGPTQR